MPNQQKISIAVRSLNRLKKVTSCLEKVREIIALALKHHVQDELLEIG